MIGNSGVSVGVSFSDWFMCHLAFSDDGTLGSRMWSILLLRLVRLIHKAANILAEGIAFREAGRKPYLAPQARDSETVEFPPARA